MKLHSLSATSANVYLGCPKRWQAEYEDRMPTSAGIAANLGTACHKVAQLWVEDGHHLKGHEDPLGVLRELWEHSYWRHLPDASKYDEGWKMMETWLARQEWEGREVLSTERKRSFTLQTSAGPVPFNYIMDRVDRLANGDVEVIDYKTLSWPVSPDDLRMRVQSRAYALAAHLEYPQARRIWVTFDMFRFEPIGVVFTREECEATLAYLTEVAEQILADDEPQETLNPECRFCPRKHVCARLAHFVEHAGDVTVGDIAEAVAARGQLELARKAIVARLAELDEVILEWAKAQDDGEDRHQVGGYVVSVGYSRRRVVDTTKVANILGPKAFLELEPSVGVTRLDELLKSGVLSPETASRVRQAISWRAGQPSISIRPVKG